MARVLAGNPEQTNRLVLIAALVFAGLAAVLVFAALRGSSGGGGGGGAAATAQVVVAARDIAANVEITPGMLELRAVDAGAVLAGALTDTQPAVGLVARYPIEAGEQVTPAKLGLSAIEDERDLALVLDPGERAVAVEVEEVTAVGGVLLPGNAVDVIAVFPDGPARRGGLDRPLALGDLKAITLLQNIEVLAVAQEALEPVPPGEDGAARGQRSDDIDRQPQARSVTLAVTQADAQLLALVQETGGVIWLTLRPAGEEPGAAPGGTDLTPFFPAPQ